LLTPEQLDAFRDKILRVTDPLIEFLLTDIARRIAEAGQLTSTAAYEVWRVQNLGMSQRQVEKAIAKLLDKSKAEIKKLMTQAAKVGYNFDIKRFPTVAAIPFDKNLSIQQTVAAAIKLAQDDFTNITQTLGMIDPYGRVMPLQDVYRSCTDFAFMQVFTGAADYETAIRQAVKNIAAKGLLTIDYQSGVHTSLEAAVRRNIMGGMGLMVQEISKRNHDDLGCDGWEISAHAGSAPDHEPIQGRQYSDEEYEALNSMLQRPIGTLNCGHMAFPIVLGVSKPQYTEEQLAKFRADNREGITYQGKHYTIYEATQKQREIERAMRLQKRRILLARGSGDVEQAKTANIRLAVLNQEYMRFSKAAGLRTDIERAQVAGFGKSQVGLAAAVARNMKSMESLLGVQTPTGVTVFSVSQHFLERSVQRGLTSGAVKDALQNPIKFGNIKTDDLGRRSQRFYGKDATVNINPDTGQLVTAWKTSSKKKGGIQ